jgi:hypothetical protein
MNQLNINFPTKVNVNICVGIILFVFWSSFLTPTESHAQEHAFIDEHNCHVCPLSEESSAEIIQSTLPFQFLFQDSPKSELVSLPIIFFSCICLSNSDPPTKF